MSQITYPFTINNGDLVDAGPVMANLQAVASVVNGNLEVGTNVNAAPAAAQTGAAIAEGSSPFAARADHQHSIRGFEQLTADPTTGNFVPRVYANTSTSKIRMCINAAGAGSWITIGNMAASDLPNHQGNHVGAGSDALNPPAVVATRATTQSIPTGTPTALVWNALDVFDTDTMHDNVTNNTRIKFTHGGVYRVSCTIAWDVNNTGLRQLWLQVNGAGPALAYDVDNAPSATKESSGNCHTLYKATAGDYVEAWVNQNSGGGLNVLSTAQAMSTGTVNAPRYFSAHWVGTGV